MNNKIIYSEKYVIEHTFTSKIIPNIEASIKINNKEQDSFTGFIGTAFSYICSAEGYEIYKDNGVIGNENEEVNITLTPIPHKLVIKTNILDEDLHKQVIVVKKGDDLLDVNNLLLYPGEEVIVSVSVPDGDYRSVEDVHILMGTDDMEYHINLVHCNCSLTFFVNPLFADIKIIKHNDTVTEKYWANKTAITQLAIGDTIEFTISENGYETETGNIVIEQQNQEFHLSMKKNTTLVNFNVVDQEDSTVIEDAEFTLNGTTLQFPYQCELPLNKTFQYSVSAPGYLETTDSILLTEDNTQFTIYLHKNLS